MGGGEGVRRRIRERKRGRGKKERLWTRKGYKEGENMEGGREKGYKIKI